MNERFLNDSGLVETRSKEAWIKWVQASRSIAVKRPSYCRGWRIRKSRE